MQRAAAAALLAAAAPAAGAAPPAGAGSVTRVGTRGRWFTDAHRRVRIFHGLNDVGNSKGTGHTPGGADYLPKHLPRYYDALQVMGFTAFRLPMMWAAVMPAPDSFDDAYLGSMRDVVRELGRRGMYGFLDMHQDVLSSAFGGYDGAPRWLVNRTAPRRAYPWPLQPPLKNWAEGYVTEAVGQAFQDIYDNAHGGMDAWAAFWRRVAGTFRGEAAVLGYELINEPWAGDVWRDPLLLLPGTAGKKNLAPAYDRLAAAIREVDDETMVMFEPVTWGYLFSGDSVAASGFTSVPGGAAYANRTCLSWHYYCWVLNSDYANGTAPYPPLTKAACDEAQGPLMFGAVEKDGAELGTATILTEFGALAPDSTKPDSKETEEIEWILDEADRRLQSWTYWDIAGLVDAAGALRPERVDAFVRPYASAVAGVPSHMSYDRRAGTLTVQYTPSGDATAPTEVVVPPLRYPNGYNVTLSAGLTAAPCPASSGGGPLLCVSHAAAAVGAVATVVVAPVAAA